MATQSEGGFGWAEREMLYQEADKVVAPDAVPALWTPDQGQARALTPKLVKRTLREQDARATHPSPSAVKLATAGGAQLELVMSRQLRACVMVGLALGFAKTLRLSVPRAALEHDPHWYVPSIRM